MATAATELDLPGFEYLDPELRGERFHAELRALRETGRLASMPHRRRAAPRGDPPQHPAHQRAAAQPAARAREPGVHAARRGALAPHDAGHHQRPVRRHRGRRVRRGGGAVQAVPVAGDRHDHGRADRGRRPPVGLVDVDPAPVRHEPCSTCSSAASTRPRASSRTGCEHPEQWRQLARDPGLAPNAGDEIVRYEPITPFTARIAMEDVTYRDVLFPRDTIVPCARMPDLQLAGDPRFGSIDGIYGLDRLPLRWTPTASPRA